ncbi:MAG: DUF2847 family protein [Ignavibacteria bacterium]|nr:DUF2847 family protein [Ignavibacteria bacterium]
MNWINIETEEKLGEIKEISASQRILVFRFSPGSVIDFVMKRLLEREWAEGEMGMETFLVDVVYQKSISQKIADDFSVEHESPQVIIIENGKPIFSASNGKILFSEIRKFRN